MKGGKPMTAQTSLRNLLQKPSLLVNTPRTRKEGGGEEEERRRERRKQRCSQLRTIVQDTPKKERGDPEYYIQENPRRQGKKGGKAGGEGG